MTQSAILKAFLATFYILCALNACPIATASNANATAAWPTAIHDKGYCATYGICGHRDDGDPLSCATNTPAQPLDSSTRLKLEAVCPQLAQEVGAEGSVCCTEEQLDLIQRQIQIASIFLVGCPACNHNFKHFFCLLTCSPDQATFSDVITVQTANDTQADNAVLEMDVFLSPEIGKDLFSSCEDVVYPPSNQKAMKFVGGGASNYQEWVDFLGLVKDKRRPPTGSPFQINFPSFDELPGDMAALEGRLASCGEAPLACSCGDCPAAPGCEPAPPPPPPPPGGCPALHIPGSFTCMDITMAVAYLAVLACIPAFVRFAIAQQQAEAETEEEESGAQYRSDDLAQPLLVEGSASQQSEVHPLDNQGLETRENVQEVGSYQYCEYPAGEQILRRGFRALGMLCASRPWRTLAISALFCLLLSSGIARLHVVTDPEKLWVGPDSQAAQEKANYEAAFGPFYRIAQLIFSTTPLANSSRITPSGLPSIVTDDNLRLLFDVQDLVDSLRGAKGEGEAGGMALDDLCFKPLGDACATQSVLQYWQGSREEYESPSRLSPEFCVDHWSTSCRATTGAPVDPKVVLGGFPLASTSSSTSLPSYVNDSTAFIITYPLSSAPELKEDAEAWEAAFLDLARGQLSDVAASAGLSLSFSAQRSVEDELQRESGADISTVAISYLLMMVYVAVALAVVPRRSASFRGILVHGRASLALGGVLLVALAVVGALGVCGWSGLGATLIIMEVIPFLALAIGVDNVFILTMAADRAPREVAPAQRAAAALAAAGPSMALAAAAETAGFALGLMTSMPALRDFAACAAAAIAINCMLQITAFPALLALDAQRVQEQRYDCAPWIRAPAPWIEEEEEEEAQEERRGEVDDALQETPVSQETSSFSSPPRTGDRGVHCPLESAKSVPELAFGTQLGNIEADEGMLGVAPALRWYMRKVHAPVLRIPVVKGIVLALFAGAFFFSCAMLPRLERGLDQGVALPQDSYLQDYFADIANLLRVGPPVSFVVRNLNLSENSSDISRVCSVAGCEDDSLLNRVASAARTPWRSSLAGPAASWLDDFLSWSSPEIPQCCRVFPNGTFCPPPDQPPCSLDPDACDACVPCFSPSSSPSLRPTESDFELRLPQFMAALPSQQCAKGGVGAYSSALQRDANDPTGIAGLSQGMINASAFQTYYLPLASQKDFIAALAASRDLAATASSELGLDVFGYSIFHIFFEQYLNIGGQALAMLGSAAVAAFALCMLATGSPWAAALVLTVLCMLCVDLAGVMALTGIQVNAVSLVNLAAAVGIGLEFCVHVLHAFMEETGGKERRAAAALGDVGAAVLCGITATKLVGVAVLAFAHTAIFRVYFFKFYLALVVLGAAHGLIFLPVILSTIGPEAFEHWTMRRVLRTRSTL